MAETLAKHGSGNGRRASTPHCVGKESVAGAAGGHGLDTLLGPERTTVVVFSVPGAIVLLIPAGSCGSWCLVGGVAVVGWLLVENCTVDASILFFVVKLSRANGGCLGTRSR